MRPSFLLLGLLALSAEADETILSVFIFSRHGDRTPKSTPPTRLTALGYQEVFTSGTYFRDRYITGSSAISDINRDVVGLSQITASAPLDNVLFTSAQAFLQGLYPPTGEGTAAETLRNGTEVQPPLSGYQLIPVQTVMSGTGSEDSAWLQGSSNCANALASSNDYYSSAEYHTLLETTQELYTSVAPAVNQTFSQGDVTYKNAYTIYDLLNVASIHNSSFPSSLLQDKTLSQLRTLADRHELALAHNDSQPVRAIAGATLASEIVKALNQSITSKGKQAKLTVQFGAYASFLAFFGLAGLLNVGEDFHGVPDYASTMTFELFTTAPNSSFPSTEELSVRFLFHNGTTSNISQPTAFPLFGQEATTLPWNDFVSSMNRFAIGDQADWCHACGNQTGVCAPFTTSFGSQSVSRGHDGGISRPIAGVIGAMVTLAVVLGLEALAWFVAGLSVVRKKRPAGLGEKSGGDEISDMS